MNRADIVAERLALKARFGALYDQLLAELFALDPIGINYGHNTDEYDPEVRPILAGIGQCASREHVLALVHRTFVQLFDPEMAGAVERYDPIADWLWAERHRWQGRSCP